MDSPVRMISKYNNEWFETPDNFFTDFKTDTANKYQQMNIYRDLDPQHDLFFTTGPIKIAPIQIFHF